MTERIVKLLVKNQVISRYYLRNKSGNFNGHIIDPGDMTVLSDSVSHMARAIISDAISLGDRNVKIDDEAKVNVPVPEVSLSKKKRMKLSLGDLKENFKEKSFEEKASFAELLSGEVKNEYEKIKSDKNVRDCVSNIKTALKVYKNRKTSENAKKVVDAQLALMKVLNKKKYTKYIKETLSKIFTRVAVEDFQKEFGDLKRVKTLREMKLFLNKLYEDIKDAKGDKYSDECEDSLIYGFGHYPSSMSINLNELKENSKKAKNVAWALKSMSLGYPVFSKNGKHFEIFDTGSYNDKNCAFRAVAVGAGFGPNGYNKIQQKIIEGAKKLLDELKEDSGHRTLDIDLFLKSKKINLSESNEECLAKFLDKYIKDREKGFVAGMGDIEYSLAAIGLGRPICAIDIKNGSEYTYSPYGKKIDGIKHDAKDKPIYISKLQGHAVALLPLRKNSNLFNDSELAQKVEGAVKKSITNIMMEEIAKGKNSKLLSSMSKYLNFYYDYKDENKKEDNENLFIAMDMIHKIVKEMSTDETKKIKDIWRELKNLAEGIVKNGNDVKTIESKLEEYLEVISQKAVSICKDNPLFWNNYVQSL